MPQHAFDLSGQTAIVTGCSRGLGEGIACALARAGAGILGVDVLEGSESLERLCQTCNVSYRHVRLDLGLPISIDTLVQEARRERAGVHVLVNNAGIIRRAPALDFTQEDWDDVMTVNLKTVFFLSREFAKLVVEKRVRGKIINIASMLSFQGSRNVASYTASKAGLAGLTRLLANEFAPLGINVNALAPGYMDTQNTAPLRRSKKSAQVLEMIPAGRWGTPDDLGGPAVFLASAASDYVHGTIIPVDGGWLSGNF